MAYDKESEPFDFDLVERRGLLRCLYVVYKRGRVSIRDLLAATHITKHCLTGLVEDRWLTDEFGDILLSERAREFLPLIITLEKGLERGLGRTNRREARRAKDSASRGKRGGEV